MNIQHLHLHVQPSFGRHINAWPMRMRTPGAMPGASA
jgi:hypothetical protein